MIAVKEIRMVDRATQYQRIKTEVDAAIAEVLTSTQFIKGPQVKKFEDNLAKYLGAKHVIGCANGTDALQIAMMALDLQPGDEVITTSFTFLATVEVIALLKLKPVLVDVTADTFTMDIESLKKAITPKTKAIVPVHLFGQCADMEAIMDITKQYNLYVIEDNAQAIGADYTYANGTKQKAGVIGHIGTTSFFPSKNLGCYGDGGAIFTNDDALAERIRMVANHGQSKQYVHDIIGVNSRLDTIQAAVLDVKLQYLDEYAAKRLAVADVYDAAFANIAGVTTPARAHNSTHVFHQYTLQLDGMDRDIVRQKLQEKGVPSMIYYPIPVHKQKAYYNSMYTNEMFRSTNKLCETVLSLPIHTEMDAEQQTYIIESVKQSLK